MKRVLAIAITGLLGAVLVGVVQGISPVMAWLLLAAAVVACGWLVTRSRPHLSIATNGAWQGQSRGTATVLVIVGTLALVAGMLYEAGNPPNQYGLILFAIASLCLGIGIHRNPRVVTAYFGRPWGWVLNGLQFVLPLVAFALDYAASAAGDQGTKWPLRFLAVIPFLFLYLAIWIPLARLELPTAPRNEESTLGRVG